MKNKETGEFELVVGNGQLISGFFILVLLLAVFFAMGFIVARAKYQQEPAPRPRPRPSTQPELRAAAPRPRASAASRRADDPRSDPPTRIDATKPHQPQYATAAHDQAGDRSGTARRSRRNPLQGTLLAGDAATIRIRRRARHAADA